jgi:uncharacterized protein
MGDLNYEFNRVVWCDVPVENLRRAAGFYSAVLNVGVAIESFDEHEMGVLDHQDGNGGCLFVRPNEIRSDGGPLVYFNVDGRIRAAVAARGGNVLEPIQSMGSHGFRAVVLDSEGNRIALHSRRDA